MLKKSAQNLSAAKLRAILIGTIILLIVLCSVGFWFFRGQLMNYADQVKVDAAAASVSSNDISRLQQIQQKLQDDSVAVTRAKSIVADSQSYQYQNQVIDDITAYAKAAGLHVASFAFSTGNLPGAAGTPAPATAGTPVAQSSAPAGLKVLTTTVTIKVPADYQAVMRFIHSIEVNLTKMQLTGISMTAVPNDPSRVNVNPFTIEVYTK